MWCCNISGTQGDHEAQAPDCCVKSMAMRLAQCGCMDSAVLGQKLLVRMSNRFLRLLTQGSQASFSRVHNFPLSVLHGRGALAALHTDESPLHYLIWSHGIWIMASLNKNESVMPFMGWP